MLKLHIDIETFSSVDIMTSGAYKYVESVDFEILMVAFSYGSAGDIELFDLAAGDRLSPGFLKDLHNPRITKVAHNANFERNAFRAVGANIPIEQWECTQIKAAYCGLPLSLDGISAALDLGEHGKDAAGKNLIRYFSIPQKPVKSNQYRTRNFWYHDLEKWEAFKAYCVQDVKAEKRIDTLLKSYEIIASERALYQLDQKINDRGIGLDLDMATKATELDDINSAIIGRRITELTGIDKPNSTGRLKEWFSKALKKEIKSLAKTEMPALKLEAAASAEVSGTDTVLKVLELREKAAKTSTKKYTAMLNCVCYSGRIHGLFQFYGANRTGRWAGRLVQMQNLPQNHLKHLDQARQFVKAGNYENMSLMYDNVSSVLSQLIRTAFVAPENKTFAVADFSAIEARVIAWLAQEQWRLDVFATHGKIYEASASKMLKIPIEQIDKGSPERQKGKVAELALGYQGSIGALKKMGGEAMGLSEIEMGNIVKLWRKENAQIVAFWRAVEKAAIQAVKTKRKVVLSRFRNLAFECDSEVLTIELPSGRKLFYQEPRLTTNRFDNEAIKYKGVDQLTKKWWWTDSYGGKFVENIVQAVARDLLAYSMLKLDGLGYKIVMHVHDEVVVEVNKATGDADLKDICTTMGRPVPWADGLILSADGYTTDYYKKD